MYIHVVLIVSVFQSLIFDYYENGMFFMIKHKGLCLYNFLFVIIAELS